MDGGAVVEHDEVVGDGGDLEGHHVPGTVAPCGHGPGPPPPAEPPRRRHRVRPGTTTTGRGHTPSMAATMAATSSEVAAARSQVARGGSRALGVDATKTFAGERNRHLGERSARSTRATGPAGAGRCDGSGRRRRPVRPVRQVAARRRCDQDVRQVRTYGDASRAGERDRARGRQGRPMRRVGRAPSDAPATSRRRAEASEGRRARAEGR